MTRHKEGKRQPCRRRTLWPPGGAAGVDDERALAAFAPRQPAPHLPFDLRRLRLLHRLPRLLLRLRLDNNDLRTKGLQARVGAGATVGVGWGWGGVGKGGRSVSENVAAGSVAGPHVYVQQRREHAGGVLSRWHSTSHRQWSDNR